MTLDDYMEKCNRCEWGGEYICLNGEYCHAHSKFKPRERTYVNMFVDDMKKKDEVTFSRCQRCVNITTSFECGYFDTHCEPLMEDSEDCDGYVQKEDAIKPIHYSSGKYDVIWFCQYHNLSFDIGNIIKYIFRAGKKDKDKELQDLRKAREYLERRIEFIEAKVK